MDGPSLTLANAQAEDKAESDVDNSRSEALLSADADQKMRNKPQPNEQPTEVPSGIASGYNTLYDLNDDVPTCRICHCTENNCDSLSGDNYYEPSSNDLTNVPLTPSNLLSSSPQLPTSSVIFNPISDTSTAKSQNTADKGSLTKKSCISINIPGSSSHHNQLEEQIISGSSGVTTAKDNNKNLSKDAYQSNKLISPCHCSGSLKWVHHNCLQQWLSATNSQRCELCKYQFNMTVKYKPIYKWRALNASPSDRRRLICNSVLNLILMICVFWSTYVLIERASSDARYGQIDWSFWTKMCVITIGFIGGVIFLFVQLRLYLSIFIRWRQSNRIIIIRNVDRDNKTNTDKINTGSRTDSKCTETARA